MPLSRRAFLGTTLLGCLASCSQTPNLSFDTFALEIVKSKLSLANLPQAFSGYKIAFVSDFHFGPFVPHDYLADTVKAINSEFPDIVILGGDYIGIPDRLPATMFTGVNNKFDKPKSRELIKEIYRDFATIFAALKAQDGVLAILGNHDHWNDKIACLSSLEGKAIQCLVNKNFIVRRGEESLNFFGVDDFWTGIPRADELRALNLTRACTIVLAHNPDFLDRGLQAKRFTFDLALAGHTHGGQIKLPLIGAAAGYNVKSMRFREGLSKADDSQVYVSRGVGVVDVPIRLNCRPELTILELTRT